MADDQDDDNEGEQSAYSPSAQNGAAQNGTAEPPELPAPYATSDSGGSMNYGAPRITPGGPLGPGYSASDPRSRYTAEFAGGHQMQVIGGGQGQGPLRPPVPGQAPMPLTGQVQLTRAESIQMQVMQNAISDTQQKVASGSLDEGTGKQMIRRIQAQLAPLLKRQSQAAIAQAQQQHQTTQVQLGQADSLTRDRIPNLIFNRPMPDGSSVEYAFDAKTGMPKATEYQQHLWKMQQLAAQNAAKHDPAEEQRKAEEHDRTDYEKVYKMLTKDAVDSEGKKTGEKIEPSHDDVEEFRSQRDLRTQGPQAYAAAMLKKYPDVAHAPRPAVKRRIFEIANPGLSMKATGLPLPGG